MSDNEQLSEKELAWGYWFLTHKELLRTIGVWVMIVLSVALWGFAIIRFGYFILVEEPKTKAALQQLPLDLANTRGLRDKNVTVDAQLVETKVFPSGDGQYDFVARVLNPNSHHAAKRLTYAFSYDGGQTPDRTATLLPNGEMVVYTLGVALDSPPRNVQFIASPVQWSQIVGWDELKAKKLDLEVSDIKVTPIPSGVAGSIVHFVVTNKTVFNFWSVDSVVLLQRGTETVGVNAAQIEQLKSGESREVSLQWFGAPQATTVDVRPQVNILDPSVFMGFSGGTPNVLE